MSFAMPTNVVTIADAVLCPSKELSDLLTAADRATVASLPEFPLQPLYDLRSRQPHGYEALLRVNEAAGEVRPKDWRRVDYKMLALLGKVDLGIKLYINLANETIVNVPDELIRQAVAKNDIVFEWNEIVLGDRAFATVINRLNHWIQTGVRIAIDDYGRGLDGLWRLSAIHYRAAAVKLDGGLLRLMDESPFAVTVIAGVIRACKEQGIPVISECIETKPDFDKAITMGVDMVQGFYIDGGRP